MKRAFIAINLPETVKKQISKSTESLKSNGIKKVEEKNLHITILFLGNKKQAQIEEILNNLKKMQNMQSFKAKTDEIGVFGGRVLWLGVKPEKNFEEIFQQASRLLGESQKKFHPHITIARNKKLDKKSFLSLTKKIKCAEGEFEVKSVDLMESVLTAKGPEYKVLGRITLSA